MDFYGCNIKKAESSAVFVFYAFQKLICWNLFVPEINLNNDKNLLIVYCLKQKQRRLKGRKRNLSCCVTQQNTLWTKLKPEGSHLFFEQQASSSNAHWFFNSKKLLTRTAYKTTNSLVSEKKEPAFDSRMEQAVGQMLKYLPFLLLIFGCLLPSKGKRSQQHFIALVDVETSFIWF